MIQQFHIFLHISAKCNIYKIYVRTLFYIYENYVTHVTIYVHILHIYVHICCIYVRSVWESTSARRTYVLSLSEP